MGAALAGCSAGTLSPMDAGMRVYLDRLYAEGHAFDAQRPDRHEQRRNIEPASGALLADLIRLRRAQRVLEIGTSNGYSTLWLAHALAATGGELLGVDVDGPRSAEAAAHLRSTGLAGQVTLVLRDAADVLREEAGTFDLILVDAERPAYPDYLPDLRRLVDPAGGTLVVDNVVSHAAEVEDFLAMAFEVPEWHAQVLKVGAGLLLAVHR